MYVWVCLICLRGVSGEKASFSLSVCLTGDSPESVSSLLCGFNSAVFSKNIFTPPTVCAIGGFFNTDTLILAIIPCFCGSKYLLFSIKTQGVVG